MKITKKELVETIKEVKKEMLNESMLVASYDESDIYDFVKESELERLKEDDEEEYNRIKDSDKLIDKYLESEDISYYYEDAFNNFVENVNDILEKYENNFNSWIIKGKNIGWRNLSGKKIVRVRHFNDLKEKILPRTNEFTIKIYESDKPKEYDFYMVVYHHDSPTGEIYYFKKYDGYEIGTKVKLKSSIQGEDIGTIVRKDFNPDGDFFEYFITLEESGDEVETEEVNIHSIVKESVDEARQKNTELPKVGDCFMYKGNEVCVIEVLKMDNNNDVIRVECMEDGKPSGTKFKINAKQFLDMATSIEKKNIKEEYKQIIKSLIKEVIKESESENIDNEEENKLEDNLSNNKITKIDVLSGKLLKLLNMKKINDDEYKLMLSRIKSPSQLQRVEKQVDYLYKIYNIKDEFPKVKEENKSNNIEEDYDNDTKKWFDIVADYSKTEEGKLDLLPIKKIVKMSANKLNLDRMKKYISQMGNDNIKNLLIKQINKIKDKEYKDEFSNMNYTIYSFFNTLRQAVNYYE